MSQKLRIGIDCRLSGKQHAGIGRYIENLVQRLPVDQHIEWILFFHDQKQADEVLQSFNHSTIRPLVKLIPVKHYSLAEQLKLPQVFMAAKLDLLHVPHFNVPIFYHGKLVVTIHDLLWHEQKGTGVTTLPKWQYWLKYLGYRLVASQAIYKANKIIVPSETIKQTLSRYYPQAQKKVVVIKEGIDRKFQKLKTKNQKTITYTLHPTPYTLLYVGSLYPHKNLELVFQALKQLPEVKLNIVSARSAFRDKLEHQTQASNLKHQISFLGYILDKELIKLYHSSLALVQPSLSEGFGLTGVEAMAAGCPVLASDIPVFKEIYGQAAIYFDPKSTESLIKAIEQLRQLSNLERNKLIKKGREQTKQYSWDEMVKETIKVYGASK